MRIVFMGTPDFAVPSLKALLAAGYDVVGVFTQPDRPKGRGGKLAMSPVKETALENNIPVFQPEKIRKDGLEMLRSLAPDLCVTAAFGQILSQAVLDIPPMGTVNVHASLLPRHRGAAPVQWAILQGDTCTGVTTMFTDKGIDTGDILLSTSVPIEEEDTADSLLVKLSQAGAELLIETLRRIEDGTCPRIPQNESIATYDPMLTKEMGILDFSDTVQNILHRVRAMASWPCAYVPLQNGSALKIWQAKAAEGKGEPGTILHADPKGGLVIAAGDGGVQVLRLQAPGAKAMDAGAYLRGHPLQPGKLITEVEA